MGSLWQGRQSHSPQSREEGLSPRETAGEGMAGLALKVHGS